MARAKAAAPVAYVSIYPSARKLARELRSKGIKVNRQGIASLLTSRGALRAVGRKAQETARAAGPGFGFDSQVGPDRARGAAIAMTFQARRGQKADKRLTRALRG